MSTADEETQKTDEIIAATEKLKKGLMQQLFNVSGKQMKSILRKLGEVATLSTGTTPATSNKEYYEDNIPFIKTNQVVNERILHASLHISDSAVEKYCLKKFQPGTILVAMYGQGKTRGQTALLEIEACTTQNAAAIEPGKEIDSEYLT